jgi:Spy/CpxP family protein refolding chaperone
MKKLVSVLFLAMIILSMFSFSVIADDEENNSLGDVDEVEDDGGERLEEVRERRQEFREDIREARKDFREDFSEARQEFREDVRDLIKERVRAYLKENGNITERDGEFRFKLRNGTEQRIKIMPEVASAIALERLRLKNCNENNSCSIELKEVGSNQTKAELRYEMKVEKRARILGFLRARMDIETEVDAETGEVLEVRRPWWAFIAVEDDEQEEVA